MALTCFLFPVFGWRKPKFKETVRDVDLPQMKVELESEAKPPLTAEQIYLKRKAEVAQQEHARSSRRCRWSAFSTPSRLPGANQWRLHSVRPCNNPATPRESKETHYKERNHDQVARADCCRCHDLFSCLGWR